jgi:UDP-N-acetylglucosamine 2-epimerase (non-hydrolysing)
MKLHELNMKKIKIVNIVGARPNFVKIAPLMHAMQKSDIIEPILLHTGQHYDYEMSESFFKELSIPEPDVYLGVGSNSHAKQVATIMEKFDDFLDANPVDMVLVVGDVNSTMACSIVAAKRDIKVVHVEAGIRSWDRSMPEEINRMVTDSIADILMPPSVDAVVNLKKEGHPDTNIFLVGNIMIDTLITQQENIDRSDILEKLNITSREYALVTLHRPSNVDQKSDLNQIIDAIAQIQNDITVVFPVHPRTQKMMDKFELTEKISKLKNVLLTNPLGYHDFGKLVRESRFVMTDSGGIQEETTVYQIPCITLRANTERPITITQGTSELAASRKDVIVKFARQILNGKWKKGSIPDWWDGKTAGRIVEVLENYQI